MKNFVNLKKKIFQISYIYHYSVNDHLYTTSIYIFTLAENNPL